MRYRLKHGGEHVARRQRCLELRQKLADGAVHSIDDLIALNLDIRQFAQDAIENCEGAELLRAFYNAICQVAILDPTCGSGAFLFAALNILEPLYDACLERMQVFVDDLNRSDNPPHHSETFGYFHQILGRVAQHPNRRYFILKSIILNNLYGVDIMEEATEICKLRLFLKLVSQVERDPYAPNYGLEPLPDIDFNIRAGNTLVGFANYEEVRKAVEGDQQKKLDLFSDMKRISQAASDVDQLFERFRLQQQELNSNLISESKRNLKDKLKTLRDELNRYLAESYKVGISQRIQEFERWLLSYQPFHWFVEFYGVIVKREGFDVIIGNPPYVEMSKIKDYKLLNYDTSDCGNIYPPCVERSSNLLHSGGNFGMIVPLSGFFTERMKSYQNHVYARYTSLHISYYSGDAHPSVLFAGVKYRLCIIIGSFKPKSGRLTKTSNYLRWYADERNELFKIVSYDDCSHLSGFLRFAKTGYPFANSIVKKMLSKAQTIKKYLLKGGKGWINYHRSPVFWIRSMDFEPYFKSATKERSTDHLKDLYFSTPEIAKAIGAILNSTCFYFWFTIQGNCRNIAGFDIESFPIGKLNEDTIQDLIQVFSLLMEDLRSHSRRRIYNYEHSGKVEYDEFYPSQSKSVIDKIDKVLAEHYCFTDEELDFIINYDIKYRLGRDIEEDE